MKYFLLTFLCASLAHAEKLAYTLIDSIPYKYENNLDCEIAVAMSVDHTHVRVVRLDNRKGAYSASYFTSAPLLFNNFGTEFNLDKEFKLTGEKVETVQASFNLKDSQYDLVLQIVVKNSITGEETKKAKTFNLEAKFFKDRPVKCLK